MTTRLRKAFINNLDSADWMDYETKGAAREKVNTDKEEEKIVVVVVVVIVVYPDLATNPNPRVRELAGRLRPNHLAHVVKFDTTVEHQRRT